MMFAGISDIKTLDEYGGYNTEYDKVTFFVQDPKELDSVIKDVEDDSSIDWAGFYVKEDDTLYRDALSPLKNMNIFLTVLIAATFIIAFLTFYILLTIRVKDRKHEIGIYLSVGISKKNILLQLLVECMLIMSAAYIIAGAASVRLADSTGDFLLTAFTPEAEEAEEISEQDVLEQSRNGTVGELFSIKETSGTPENINSSLSLPIVAGLYLVLSLILLAAVSISSRPILHMKPVDIFQDYY